MTNLLSKNYFSLIFSSIITLLTFILFSEFYDEYKIDIIKKEGISVENYIQFGDVNNDGTSDKLIFTPDKSINGFFIEYFNISGSYIFSKAMTSAQLPVINSLPQVVDLSSDNINEILFVYEAFDHIFLNYHHSGDVSLNDVFLDTIPYYKFTNAYDFNFIGFYDVNKDGWKEVYLYLAEGYRLYPRKIYCVDIKNNCVLYESEHFGAFTVSYFLKETDKGVRIVTGSQAVGNYFNTNEILYNDIYSYMMIFDEKLKLVAEPLEFKHLFSKISVFPINFNGEDCILSVKNPNNPDSIQSIADIIDFEGNLLKSINFKINENLNINSLNAFVNSDNSMFYYNTIENQLMELNIENEKFRNVEIKNIVNPIPVSQIDIDLDGVTELIFKEANTNEYAITRNDFKKTVYFSTAYENIDLKYFSSIINNSKINLFCRGKVRDIYFKYSRNDNFIINNLISYGLIFIISLIIFSIINFLVKTRIKKRIKFQHQIQNLKFQNLRNQMSPHFTLNVINTISSAIIKDQKDEAYDYINRFSKLIRSMFVDVDSGLRTLKTELDFVESYIILQKARFKNKFEVIFDIDKNVDTNILVPPLIIQNFVENSIKHGFKNITEGGIIKITINKTNEGIFLIVEDNGIGRLKAENIIDNNSTGRGNKVLNEYIELINKSNKKEIFIEIFDLQTNNSSGTKVIIFIPYGLKEFSII